MGDGSAPTITACHFGSAALSTSDVSRGISLSGLIFLFSVARCLRLASSPPQLPFVFYRLHVNLLPVPYAILTLQAPVSQGRQRRRRLLV